MIIPLINQALLLTDTSQKEVTRATALLKESGIEYYLKTSAAGGSILAGRMADVAASKYSNYNTLTDNVGQYVYRVYVKRKDHEKAKEVITRKKGDSL